MDQVPSVQTSRDSHHVTLSIHAILEGHLKCVDCHNSLMLAPDRLSRDRQFSVQCPCGMVYDIYMGSRRYARKATCLPGRYCHLDTPGQSGDILVEDISFGGICLRPAELNGIAIGDHLLLDFILDDGLQSRIQTSVCVRDVWQETIGVEFDSAGGFDRALAAYLIR